MNFSWSTDTQIKHSSYIVLQVDGIYFVTLSMWTFLTIVGLLSSIKVFFVTQQNEWNINDKSS